MWAGVRERAGWGLLKRWTHSQTHPHQHCQHSKINLYASNLIGGEGGIPKATHCLQTCCGGFHGVAGGGSKSYAATTPTELFAWRRGRVRVNSVGRAYGWQQQLDAAAVVWPPSGETWRHLIKCSACAWEIFFWSSHVQLGASQLSPLHAYQQGVCGIFSGLTLESTSCFGKTL